MKSCWSRSHPDQLRLTSSLFWHSRFWDDSGKGLEVASVEVYRQRRERPVGLGDCLCDGVHRHVESLMGLDGRKMPNWMPQLVVVRAVDRSAAVIMMRWVRRMGGLRSVDGWTDLTSPMKMSKALDAGLCGKPEYSWTSTRSVFRASTTRPKLRLYCNCTCRASILAAGAKGGQVWDFRWDVRRLLQLRGGKSAAAHLQGRSSRAKRLDWLRKSSEIFIWNYIIKKTE